MSKENIENLIGQMVRRLNARDVDGLMALLDPELEFYSRLLQVDGRSYQGKEGMRRFLTEVDEAFAGAHWTLDEIIRGAGDDLVVVLSQSLRGRASQAPLEVPSYQVWKLRNGRPWHIAVYGSRGEALEAGGLAE